MEIENLLEYLAQYGGKIVSSNDLNTEQIRQAQASNRMYVDNNSLGYVWEPIMNKFPTTVEEVKLFEKWYPLDMELPEDLKTYKPYFQKTTTLSTYTERKAIREKLFPETCRIEGFEQFAEQIQIATVEPLEKRIAELEKSNSHWAGLAVKYSKEIDQFEEEH